MKTSKTRFAPMVSSAAILAALHLLLTCPLFAQDGGHGFKEGQKIQWKDRISGQWQDGTFLYETPGGKQPVIQQRPGDAGSQTAYDWDNVRQPMAAKKPAAAPAAGKGMKPGQIIQWRDKVSGKWQQGEFVGETPGGKQPIILQRPGEPGTQTAYTWDNIKAGTDDDGPDADAPPKPVKPAPGQPKPGKAKPATPPAAKPAPADPAAAPGGKPLTEDEVKKFFTDRIPGKWSDDPEKFRQVKAELDALIKKRGTAFIYNTGLNDFGDWLGAHGMGYEGPISHNYGPPNDQNWLFGSWVTSKTGLPVHWVEGDKRITWQEIGASKTGTVTISKDGTYRWDTGQGIIEDKWHEASGDEMGDQGGAGVVLEGAKNGEPWVAFKYRASNPGEEWLGLAEVNRRSVREGAMRVPEGK